MYFTKFCCSLHGCWDSIRSSKSTHFPCIFLSNACVVGFFMDRSVTFLIGVVHKTKKSLGTPVCNGEKDICSLEQSLPPLHPQPHSMHACVCVCPTKNGVMQNGSSVGIRTQCMHVFCTSRVDLYVQSVIINKISASELSRKLVKNGLLVGWLSRTRATAANLQRDIRQLKCPWQCCQLGPLPARL